MYYYTAGYEWDVGIHYIGEMGTQTLNKTLLDQISNGQIEWAPLEQDYDIVQIGYDEDSRTYPVTTGMEPWRNMLKKQFPDEHKVTFLTQIQMSFSNIFKHCIAGDR